MYVSIIERIWKRRAIECAAVPHCVRCGRSFVASGLDEASRCWFCAKALEVRDSPDVTRPEL